MQGRRFASVVVALSLTSAARATPTSIPPANQPLSGPATAVENLAQAYRDRSPAAIGGVLTADYVFHGYGDSLPQFMRGSPRAVEMDAVRGMLQGVKHGDQVLMPAADQVEMVADGVSQQLDPEHPDSTEHYRVITVKRFGMHIRFKDYPDMVTPASVHVFHVVRGDAAVRAMGQTSDPDRWYIRRWLEDVSGLRTALNEKKGDCGERDPGTEPVVAAGLPVSPGVPAMLGIRALTNPACALLRVSCELPGSEPAKVEVYDVSGRLVNTRQLAVKSAGSVSVDAGAGAHLLPGVYWVRLAQAKRHPSTRMVVVAR